MKPQVNKFKFGRLYDKWGIWQLESSIPDLSPDFTSFKLLKEVPDYETALRETYRLNGWGEPKRLRIIH